MQASECGHNIRYSNTSGGITDPEYSIDVGIQNLAACLSAAEVENPIDMEHIKLALQGYNLRLWNASLLRQGRPAKGGFT